jgi:hypothetical protein
MKIAFVGNHKVDFSSETHHCKTLESMGHTVIRMQEGVVRSDTIFREASKCDMLVFIHTHGVVTRGPYSISRVFQALKDKGIPSVTYHLDLWLGIRRENDLRTDPFYRSIGYFFTVDKLMADWFNDNTEVKGVYLPAGVYGEECYIAEQHEGEQPSHDVAFVGSKGYHPEWPYRPELIEKLSAEYGDRFTHVGRDGGGSLRGDALNRFYADTKVVVGDTLCIGFEYPYYLSDRIFETTGRGGMIIHPYIKGIEDLFEVGKEIVTYPFGDWKQLFYLVDYYLAHDKEREEIRRAGHERTKRDHTYLKRWESILEEVFKNG